MHRFLSLIALIEGSLGASKIRGCTPFPSSLVEFSSNFQQPLPPSIHSEFRANFIQHKWNVNVSHITAGYLTMSPSQQYVRADEAFDGFLASSVFNYANTSSGLVDNILTTYSANSTKPTVWQGYVNPGEPLFSSSLLVNNNAVFGGLVDTQFTAGQVASWSMMYQGIIPVTVYVTDCNVVVGYEFFSPILRTRAITEFFNIAVLD